MHSHGNLQDSAIMYYWYQYQHCHRGATSYHWNFTVHNDQSASIYIKII